MTDWGHRRQSLASYVSLGPNPVSTLSSLMTRSKGIKEEEQEVLSLGDCTSIISVTSDDGFIIIDEDVGGDEKRESTSLNGCRTASDKSGKITPHEEHTSRIHHIPLSSIQQRFLKDKQSARQSVCQKLEQQGFKATFDFNHAVVEIEGKEDADEALNTIRKSVMEIKIDFTEEELQKMAAVATDIPDGEPISPFPMLSSHQEILVVMNRVEGSMKIVGLTDVVNEMSENLRRSQELLNPKTVDVTVPVRESAQDYLLEYKWDEISALATDANCLSIEMGNDGIKVSGPSASVNDAAHKIKVLVGQIRSDTFTFGSSVNMAQFTDATVRAGKNHNVMIAYKQSNLSVMSRKTHRTPHGRPRQTPGTSRARQEAKVRVLLKRLETQQADVLVNTTNKLLKLVDGQGVSNSLLKAAGNTIQQQLNTLYPHGIAHGELAVSGPGNLTTCKKIYHAALPFYRGRGRTMELSRCYEYLMSVVFRAVIKASGDGHQTIAIPAFGTGALDYPVKNVAQLIFKAFSLFNQDQRAGAIKEIFIVIAPETRLHVKQLMLAQQFSHWMNTRQIQGPNQRSTFSSRIFSLFSGIESSPSFPNYLQTEVGKTNQPKVEVRTKIGNTLLQVILGDIKKICEFTDIVMVPWMKSEISTPNDHPALRCTDPDRHLWQCRTHVAGLSRSKCTADRTTLPGKTLVHTYSKDASESCKSEAIGRGLEKAVRENYRVITLPIPTDGSLAARPGEAASAIASAIKRSSSDVYVVTVVIPADNIFIEFASALAERNKLEEPADISMTSLADTWWKVEFSGQAVRSQTRAAAFNTGVDAVMVVTSDSEQMNRAAAEEVSNELDASLHEVVDVRRN